MPSDSTLSSATPAELRRSRRLLDPVDRVSEILFGLIMALTFTCTLSVAEAGEAEVHEMLVGALGCNLAWGIVDATIFLLVNLVERARGATLIGAVRASADAGQGRRLVSDAMPEALASGMDSTALETLRLRVAAMSVSSLRRGPSGADWLAALGVFLLVVAATFPVAVPFMVTEDAALAMRTSNGIAIALLFACGAMLGRYAGISAVRIGLLMAVLGTALVAITIALGG